MAIGINEEALNVNDDNFEEELFSEEFESEDSQKELDSSVQDTKVPDNNSPQKDDDFVTFLLKSRGIDDMSKIKFEDENGSMEELDWNNLDNEEKLNILNSSLNDPDTDLDDNEIELINTIRESGLTPAEYLEHLQAEGVNSYIQNNQNQEYHRASFRASSTASTPSSTIRPPTPAWPATTPSKPWTRARPRANRPFSRLWACRRTPTSPSSPASPALWGTRASLWSPTPSTK